MSTVVTVNVNSLFDELKKATIKSRRLEVLLLVAVGCAVSIGIKFKQQSEKIESLTNEITELKKVEGE